MPEAKRFDNNALIRWPSVNWRRLVYQSINPDSFNSFLLGRRSIADLYMKQKFLNRELIISILYHCDGTSQSSSWLFNTSEDEYQKIHSTNSDQFSKSCCASIYFLYYSLKYPSIKSPHGNAASPSCQIWTLVVFQRPLTSHRGKLLMDTNAVNLLTSE